MPNQDLVNHLNAISISIKVKYGVKSGVNSDEQVAYRSELYGTVCVIATLTAAALERLQHCR